MIKNYNISNLVNLIFFFKRGYFLKKLVIKIKNL